MRSAGFDLPLLGGAVLLLLLLVVALAPLQPATAAWQAIQPGQGQAQGQGQDLGLARRSKRSWVWNQFFVVEEFKMPEPFKIGKLHSDQDPGDGSVLYLLTGEGAGSLFTIDEHTGDIRVSQALDREQQSLYTLLAQVVDAVTRQPLEPPTQFVVKVQDINDNEPRFPDEPYHASVPEMSPIGTSVTRVTATDADDSSYGNSARVVYRLLEGQPYFSIDANTGEIRTAHSNLDREARSLFRVVIEGKDMAGQKGGLTGTATVTITLEDVNDNAPLFPQGTYRASVSEAAVPGTTVGRVRAQDADEGDNARVDYRIVAGDRAGAFSIATDPSTQDGVVTLAQPLDYERKHAYTLTVEAWNPVAGGGSSGSGGSTAAVPLAGSARILVSVEDADEGPVFSPAAYEFEVAESQGPRHPLGTVTALDPDAAARPVRYSIDRNTDVDRHFDVDPLTGVLTVARPLDRESTEVFNITVIATQADDQALVGRAPVTVRVLDVNDNAPELLGPDELVLCENTPPGQAVHTFSAVDRDENHVSSPVKISLSSPSSNSNFTLTDHHNGTASLSLRRRLSRGGAEELSTLGLVLPLSVVLEDSGSPGALSSTATVRVRVCACSRRGAVTACTLQALAVLPAGLSVHALIAILACLLILLILILLFVSVRRRKKKAPSLPEDDDICENIVRYDEEGGGEEDTATFDLVTLTYPHARPLTSSACSGGGGGAHHNNNNHHHHGNNNNSHHHNNHHHHHHNINNHDGVRQPNRAPLATAAVAATTTAASTASNNRYHHSHHNQQQHRHQHHHLPPTTTSCSGGGTTAATAAAANHSGSSNNNGGGAAAPSGVRSRAGTCMDEFIQVRLREVDADPAAPPYDSVQVYGYEGSGSSVAGSLGSLSSLGSLGSEASSRSQGAPSTSTDGDQSYDYLHEWGPRFRTLAHLYGHAASATAAAAAAATAPATATAGAAAAVGAAAAAASAAAGSGSAVAAVGAAGAAAAAAVVGMAGKNVDRGGG
ncbi:cadherin-7-like [Petromyzon marinus]|uniref:cadherin-7-like n=1 Tax=Petromyzon marinus TaxID=7757 RepID=UPI003F6F8282